MPFYLSEQPLVDICALSELLQHRDLLLEALVRCVHAIEQISHIAEHDRVEADADEHPDDCEYTFAHVFAIYISKADSGEGLEGPVERLQVLHGDVGIADALTEDPRFGRETRLLGEEEPETADKVGGEENGDEDGD